MVAARTAAGARRSGQEIRGGRRGFSQQLVAIGCVDPLVAVLKRYVVSGFSRTMTKRDLVNHSLKPLLGTSLVVALALSAAIRAQSPKAEITGPVGDSPYNIVRLWHKPFA